MSHLSHIPTEIIQFRKDYGLTCFVETGCCEGAGLHTAAECGFDHLYSCDVNPDYVATAHRNCPQADIRVKNSPEWLEEIIPTLPGPALFWLDAHFPNYFSHGPKFRNEETDFFPAFREVIVIDRLDPRGVILIDDVRCFPDMGRLGELEPEFHATMPFSRIVEILEGKYTFDSSLLGRAEGIGVFISKR